MKIRRQSSSRWEGGFTLVELAIVVAIVAIVATVAIPGIRQARKRANEASAIASLKNVIVAQNQYRVRFGSFATIADLENVPYIDDNYADFQKAGYLFVDSTAPSGGFWAIEAHPEAPGATGDQYYYLDTSGLIHFRDGAPATSGDPVID